MIDSSDTKVVSARKKLEAVVAGFPKKDAAPRYTPVTAPPWSRKENKGSSKKRNHLP